MKAMLALSFLRVVGHYAKVEVFPNLEDNINVVADKASNALKNKPTEKGKKPVVENLEFKAKVNVKRKMILSKEDDRKKKLKDKSKKDVSDFELETDVVDYSSDEADRKRKKLKIKAGLKRKRSGSDSSELDTKSIKRLISKLENKVKKQESDEENVPKKGKKKLTKKVEKEESNEESVPKKGNKTLTKNVKKEESDEESVPKKGNKTLTKNVKKEESDEESVPKKGDKLEVTPSKIHDMLGVPFGGYSLSDLDEREADHEFLRNKLLGGTNHYLGPLTFLIELELKDHVVGLLDLHDEWNEVEVQESEGFIGFSKTSKKE
nr:hypothetical protein [Tanacetum cinerariifolium]